MDSKTLEKPVPSSRVVGYPWYLLWVSHFVQDYHYYLLTPLNWIDRSLNWGQPWLTQLIAPSTTPPTYLWTQPMRQGTLKGKEFIHNTLSSCVLISFILFRSLYTRTRCHLASPLQQGCRPSSFDLDGFLCEPCRLSGAPPHQGL